VHVIIFLRIVAEEPSTMDDRLSSTFAGLYTPTLLSLRSITHMHYPIMHQK